MIRILGEVSKKYRQSIHVYACNSRIDGLHCGDPAVQVIGNRRRCTEHRVNRNEANYKRRTKNENRNNGESILRFVGHIR